MIILIVSMGRGWLKETVNEIETPVFAEPTTTHEQSREVCMTINNTEDSMSVPRMPAESSEISIKKQMCTADAPLA
jgi:hypothetical protein